MGGVDAVGDVGAPPISSSCFGAGPAGGRAGRGAARQTERPSALNERK